MNVTVETLEVVRTLPRLPPRPADSNKGNFGRVLVVAGSRGMSGAAILSGSAALRGGAGLVRVATPEGVLNTVANGNPCYTSAGLPQDEQGRLAPTAIEQIADLAAESTVLAIGPGLGHSPAITTIVTYLLTAIRMPTVLDADGLNALSGGNQPSGRQTQIQHAMPLVITPHPGEFARLLATDIKTVQARRAELAAEFARDNEIIVVLKGNATIVTDGRRIFRNTTGNAGMATGGTGDVLTGLLAALLGQGLKPFEAAQLGVYLHGLAGDLARQRFGEPSLIATDLIDFLPQAFMQH